MMARARLLATMATLCGAVIGCNCSPYAGMQYDCSCGYGPGRWAVNSACGCGDQCAVGCDSGCAVACGDACGCSAGGGICSGRLLNEICGCAGCGGDLYWSEWNNDPPGCEPCDSCGNYTGPNCCASGCCESPSCSGVCAVESPRNSPTEGIKDDVEIAVFTDDMAGAIDAAFDAYQEEFDETDRPEYDEEPLR